MKAGEDALKMTMIDHIECRMDQAQCIMNYAKCW